MVEAVGIRDIVAKSLGSDNAVNVVKATMQGLQSLTNVEDAARRRGKAMEDIME